MRKLIISILCLVLAVAMCVGAVAESVYILCQPDSWVNVRVLPKKSGAIIGRYELGQEVETDGKRQNGFIHLVGLSLEEPEGWVHSGFVTDSPVTVHTVKMHVAASGRVACRRSIKGTRRKWLVDGDYLTVYAWSDTWAITNQGFIQKRFLGGF